jgi:hypothetical protein
MQFDSGALKSGRDRAGQFLSDLVEFQKTGEWTIRWDFSGEVLAAGVKGKAFTKADIETEFMRLIKNDPVITKNIQDALGFTSMNKTNRIEEWKLFLVKMDEKIGGLVFVEEFPALRAALSK